ncbi:site-specific DNA-methyltransferase [Paeniglutamicibacter gangotriensis]|uniref:Site-specific DNA-methyltransferase n=1 Tax=Paeniglutamicibacter gangotriensis TaxID=254787 RepID=A0A5B0EH56_9MICC|nr:site-specific DNA-methyltransferase [Paeniglutamicibacter gangotriensis]KAA0977151.1 site-specific DNA-methyltransferase [Paeniglutamicibacter gangotriensis]
MSKSMFEVYLNEVTDEGLRARLKAEFERTTKKFGLVFERHSPEGIRMPQAKVRRGRTVIREADGTFHKVRAISGDSVTLADERGNVIEEKLSNVTAARQFGEVVFPGLKTVGSVRTGNPEDPAHVVINGENFHALEMLGYTHPESVDLIYIDPPYNTGNKTWQYNDHYVAEKDSFRHSKWLSFMERRLTLAKKLLKTTGVIIVAIGEDEHHRLRMLMDETFGAQNFLSDVVWQGNIKNDARFTGAGMDYMVMYGSSKEALTEADLRWQEEKEGLHEILEAGAAIWQESGQDPDIATQQMKTWWSTKRDDFSPGLIEYKYIDDEGFVFSKSRTVDFPGGGGPIYDVFHPRTGNLIKPPSNGWRAPEATMHRWIAEGVIIFDDSDKKLPTVKRRLVDNSIGAPYPSFKADRRGAANRLAKMLGSKRFPNPKDHNVLMRWFRMVTSKDALILDFFGGSGSTAEAVIRLNAEDHGTRQCILVTNNELSAKDDAALRKAGHQPGSAEYEAKGVFHHVTKPRIETVVTGIRQDGSLYSAGVPANVEFLDLAYLEESRVHAALEYESLAPLFWLKSGAVGSIVQRTEDTRNYEWNEESSMAVLFNAGKAAELADLLTTKPNQVKHVFIITDSPEQGDLAGEAFGDEITVQPIYGSYLDAFQINRSDS